MPIQPAASHGQYFNQMLPAARSGRRYPGGGSISANALPALRFNPYLLLLLQRLLAQLQGHYPGVRHGGGGNDRLIGTPWNDTLYGHGGDDLLAGRGGDDRLAGGDGNDRLYGGIGNDQLRGGNGDDLLFDGIGFDRVDGGAGEDTMALPGRYDDYLIRHRAIQLESYPPREFEQFAFLNRRNGSRTLVENVEHFRFADQVLSVDQLRERVAPKWLTLTDEQNLRLLRLFGFGAGAEAGARVIDSNGDGELSAGDLAILSGGFTGSEIARRRLSAADVAYVNGVGGGDLATRLAENRSRWESLGIDDYRFRLQRSVFGPVEGNRPVDIEVRNGQVVSATWPDGTPLPEQYGYNRLTIPQVFDLIDDAIQRHADRIDVDWDPRTGIPRQLYIDYSTQIADEEIGLSISRFQPLAGVQPGGIVRPPRDVIAFGDRMPRIIPPNGTVRQHNDYVLLGDIASYPANAVSVTVGDTTVPVLRENGVYVARGFQFPRAGRYEGTLQLDDGSIVPLHIRVQFAY